MPLGQGPLCAAATRALRESRRREVEKRRKLRRATMTSLGVPGVS
jgi:hypothetical protein